MKQMKCVGRRESFSVLKLVVQIEPLCLKMHPISHGEFNTHFGIS
jgi:hypothetical protein